MNKPYLVAYNKRLVPMVGTLYTANGLTLFIPLAGDAITLASEEHAVELTEEQMLQLNKITGGIVEKTLSRLEKIKEGFLG